MTKIQVFVFNYGLFGQAMSLLERFLATGADARLLNCASAKDPPFTASERVVALPNVYYSGQWNEALRLLDGGAMFLISSDVSVRCPARLLRRMQRFYDRFGDQAGIYAPNVWWTPWTYDPALLPDLGGGLKKVVATDSMAWCVAASVARAVGPVDLNVNKIGWGIEVLAALRCEEQRRLVARDYAIKLAHPRSSAYDRGRADAEFREMVRRSGLGRRFWEYYNRRDRYGFGWRGDDSPRRYAPL